LAASFGRLTSLFDPYQWWLGAVIDSVAAVICSGTGEVSSHLLPVLVEESPCTRGVYGEND